MFTKDLCNSFVVLNLLLSISWLSVSQTVQTHIYVQNTYLKKNNQVCICFCPMCDLLTLIR